MELPILASRVESPSPPKPVIWLALFVAFMLASVSLTLVTWPKGEPTGSAWFWARVLAFPALAWCVAFGLRLFYYDDETDRLRAEMEVLEADRARAIEFAREPLAVLGSAYACALGEYGVASAIADAKQSALKARAPRPGEGAIRHTALTLNADEENPCRYRALFLSLLGELDEALSELPKAVPFEVRLQVPPEMDGDELWETWKHCWEETGHAQTSASLRNVQRGVMAVDEWLDIKAGPALEKLTLFVAAQLHADPPENSAEVGVAFLCGWAPLVERLGLKPVALLHRPVETTEPELRDTVTTGLLWGGLSAAELHHVWQAGLAGQDKPSFLSVTTELGLKLGEQEGFSGIHDIDIALGQPGEAAGWLAVALATEHAWQSGKPQMIAVREKAFSVAVVRPASRGNEMEFAQ
ncbi:hypothetical protein [Caballeronia arationis]|uniref:hypothetical protein n=1 Tax=Caballeronia arationis TaxID=1777142 RepID=UPI000B1FC0BE|nr:hypothetical protein [Caballeronia arationis]